MLSTEQIAELEQFDARGERVLSVYLDVPPDRHLRNALRAAFEDQVKELRDRPGIAANPAAEAEIERVESALQPIFERPQGKGIAIFSCAPRGLWHAEFLPVPVHDHIAFERWPDVAPLTAILNEYARYAVALIDKTHARLYTVYAGTIEERDVHFDDDVPPKQKQGGFSQSNFQRHHEEHIGWHVKDAIARLEWMAREHPFDRLILAGPVETVAEVRASLPHQLAERLVDVIPMEMFASEADILARTLELTERVERETEQRVVDQLVEADVHERGTRGLAPTLRALYLGDVRTLVVADGIYVPGVECTNPLCGLLERLPLETCPACGSVMEPVHDIVHRAMARAFSQSSRVEVVHGEPARQLQRHDGVGAILRFPDPIKAGAL
jgi:peptide subunit release factor 1 (eRF1)